MIPDFPKEKARLLDLCNSYFEKRQREYMGYFATIPSYRHHEGDKWVLARGDEESDEVGYKEIQADFSVRLTEVPSLTWETVRQKLDTAAQEMARQVVEKILRDVKEAAVQSGTFVDGGGRKLTKELFLELLDRMEVGFDEDGRLIHPIILMHPALWEKIQDDVKTWDTDPDFRMRHEQIIQRKREAWRDRESNRKLVD